VTIKQFYSPQGIKNGFYGHPVHVLVSILSDNYIIVEIREARYFVEEMTVIHMSFQGSLECLQGRAIGQNPKPVSSDPHPHKLFHMHFSVSLPSNAGSLSDVRASGLPAEVLYSFLGCSIYYMSQQFVFRTETRMRVSDATAFLAYLKK
jgi:hypothetical protein